MVNHRPNEFPYRQVGLGEKEPPWGLDSACELLFLERAADFVPAMV